MTFICGVTGGVCCDGGITSVGAGIGFEGIRFPSSIIGACDGATLGAIGSGEAGGGTSARVGGATMGLWGIGKAERGEGGLPPTTTFPASVDGTRASHTLFFASPSPFTGILCACAATGGGASLCVRECRRDEKKPSLDFAGVSCGKTGTDGCVCPTSGDPDGHITFPEPETDCGALESLRRSSGIERITELERAPPRAPAVCGATPPVCCDGGIPFEKYTTLHLLFPSTSST